jgi:hypothetical protein
MTMARAQGGILRGGGNIELAVAVLDLSGVVVNVNTMSQIVAKLVDESTTITTILFKESQLDFPCVAMLSNAISTRTCKLSSIVIANNVLDGPSAMILSDALSKVQNRTV